jgi:hypothetical protein
MARPPAASRCRSRITARPPAVRFPRLTLLSFPVLPGDVLRYVPGGQVPWCTPKMCTAGCNQTKQRLFNKVIEHHVESDEVQQTGNQPLEITVSSRDLVRKSGDRWRQMMLFEGMHFNHNMNASVVGLDSRPAPQCNGQVPPHLVTVVPDGGVPGRLQCSAQAEDSIHWHLQFQQERIFVHTVMYALTRCQDGQPAACIDSYARS